MSAMAATSCVRMLVTSVTIWSNLVAMESKPASALAPQPVFCGATRSPSALVERAVGSAAVRADGAVTVRPSESVPSAVPPVLSTSAAPSLASGTYCSAPAVRRSLAFRKRSVLLVLPSARVATVRPLPARLVLVRMAQRPTMVPLAKAWRVKVWLVPVPVKSVARSSALPPIFQRSVKPRKRSGCLMRQCFIESRVQLRSVGGVRRG